MQVFKFSSMKKFVVFLLFVASGFMFKIFTKEIPYIDEKGKEYLKSAITKAVIAYGITKGINIVSSVLKEVDIKLNIPFIGGELPIGKIFDPLDDITEKASNLILNVIGIMFAMLVVMEIFQLIGGNVFLALFILVGLLYMFDTTRKMFAFGIKLIVVIVILRLSVPIMGFLNEYVVFNPEVESRIDLAKSKIGFASELGEEMKSEIEGELQRRSFLGSIGGLLKGIKDTGKVIFKMITNMDEVIDGLIELLKVYTFIFIAQVIVIPLMIFTTVLWIWKLDIENFLGT